MALPIGATPILKGKEAAKFMSRIHEDAQKPADLTPTPKLEEACELIREYAEQRSKHVR